MNDIGTSPPTDQLTTEMVGVEDISIPQSSEKVASKHICMKDIGTQLVNIDSIQQIVKKQVSELKDIGIVSSFQELESLLPKLEGLQSSLRKTFDTQARPLIRDFHILDLPNELLRRIFRFVEDSFLEDGNLGLYSRSDYKSIQSSRMVCHRFCEASSHLLLHWLDVSMTTSSLVHLDEVSRHPLISKGVQTLKVSVGLYNSSMASDFREFAVAGSAIMRNNLYLWEAMLSVSNLPEYQYQGEFQIQMPRDTSDFARFPVEEAAIRSMLILPKKVAECSQALQSWTKIIRAESSESDEDKYIAALHRAYEKHQQLVSDQQAALRGNTFVRCISEAVARMPTLFELVIEDDRLSSASHLSRDLDPFDELVQGELLKTLTWSEASIRRLVQPPVHSLYQLPAAVGRAGTFLTKLRISFTPTNDLRLNLGRQEMIDMAKAAEHLEKLEMGCGLTVVATQPNRPPGEWTSFFKFARVFLKAPNLRSVSLDLGGVLPPGQAEEPNRTRVGMLLSLLPWTKLRLMTLSHFPIHYDELVTCLEKLEPGAYIHLRHIELLSGTWADLLDVIRVKADPASDVTSPRGGEDEEWDSDWWDEIFDGDSRLVAQYIRGFSSDNPLRPSQPPNQDDTDQEDMNQDFVQVDIISEDLD
ncbi:hypothetical protein J7T55_002698 [Diaporthe amygdali]|uniref:uncharacterized protein n=1 Tax=Phomopsis amygdali TaxID=1214568 RepID=UPI0022FE390F|nr:uncharacterized protein J7T55_002698 [Diaporthe amygdali]KAJ0122186.1 hypothetical protein J7T55_002698 [Diaporthe amygdali]